MKKIGRYTSEQILFMTSVAIFQVFGHNIISYVIFFIIIICLGSYAEFCRTIRTSPFFVLLLCFYMIFGLFVMLSGRMPTSRSLMVWGQFIGMSLLLAVLKNKLRMMNSLRLMINLLFFADFITNTLLFFNFSIPWAEVGTIRPGETYARLGGINNSALYSGSLTIFFICYHICSSQLKKTDMFLIMLAFVNLLYSGSYRFFSVLLILIFVKYFDKFRASRKLVITVLCAVIGLIVSTFLLDKLGSNTMRLIIWIKSYNAIVHNILGIGFYSSNLEALKAWSANGLFNIGVTESGILLVGICFGVVGMGLTVLMYFSVFKKVNKNTSQLPIYCLLFTFFSMCFTSFLENSLDIIFNALSIYIITDSAYKVKYAINKHNNTYIQECTSV